MSIVVIYLPVSSLTINYSLLHNVSVIRLLLKTFFITRRGFPGEKISCKILKNMEYSLKEVPEARNAIDF